MIQSEDDKDIEVLKKKMRAQTKIEVVRAGLRLLKRELERIEKIEQWEKATSLIVKSSHKINQEFQKYSRFKRT